MLEARDRVGGRTWSRTLANGALIEMGAEFILPGNIEVGRSPHELGLGLWDKGMRYGKREPRGGVGGDGRRARRGRRRGSRGAGGPRGQADRARAARLAADRRRRAGGDPRPAGDLLASRGDDVPAIDMAGLAHIDDEPAPSVAGGNQGLALGLAARLAGPVALRDPVEAVDWDSRGSGVRVLTAGGRTVEADGCVVAVPAERARPDSVRARAAGGQARGARPGALRPRRQALRAAGRAGRRRARS